MIPLGQRSQLLPIEPFLRHVPHVAEVARPQGRHREQFAEQRLAGIIRARERIELRSVAPATAKSRSAAKSRPSSRAHRSPADARTARQAEGLVGIVWDDVEAALHVLVNAVVAGPNPIAVVVDEDILENEEV